MEPSRNVSRLVEILAALRTPVTGCPWDLEQNFRSITPYTIEEVYEVVDAIERNDMENLREELGDLLLQVVYHAQMADEEKAFDFGDVVETVTRKMIRRHPHVFGDEEARSAGMAKGAWERIKAQEKAERAELRKKMGLPPQGEKTSLLDDVPPAMPPVLEAVKLQQKASKVGFDWNDPKAVLSKIREELDEFEEELDRVREAGTESAKDRLEDELGDILFALANLGRHLDIDPEGAVRRTNSKFRKRFSHIENRLKEQEKPIETTGLDEMESLWVEAKSL